MNLRTIFAALLILIGCAHIAWSDEVDKRFVQARQLYFLQRYDQALQIAESIVPQTADQWTARENLLRDIYNGQKNYAALEALIRDALSRDPHRPDLADWKFLQAEMYLKADRADSARTILDSLWQAHPTDSTINRVATLYENNTLGDWAMATYERAREFSGDSTRFAYELALLHEARRDYAGATTEYFHAMERDSISARAVLTRMVQLLKTNEGADQIESALLAAADEPETSLPAHELLVALYLETGRPDQAAEAAWYADSVGNRKGVQVIQFMRQASDRGYNQTAARLGERAVAAYPDSPMRFQVEWEMTQMTERAGNYQEAAAQYAHIARSSPAMRFRMTATLAYADLQRLHLGHPKIADSSYFALINNPRALEFKGRALLGRAMCKEMLGQFDSARAILLQMADVNPRGNPREEMAYRLAELLYFDGKLDPALEAFKAVTTDYPKGLWVNDALRRTLFLTAYRSAAESDVKALAQAEKLSRMGLHDSALARIAGLRLSDKSPLAPIAMLWAADIHLAAGDSDSALTLWDGFVTRFPENIDAPYALKRAADLCDQQLGDPHAALVRYRKLLEAYPRSHYVELARRRVRALGEL